MTEKVIFVVDQAQNNGNGEEGPLSGQTLQMFDVPKIISQAHGALSSAWVVCYIHVNY